MRLSVSEHMCSPLGIDHPEYILCNTFISEYIWIQSYGIWLHQQFVWSLIEMWSLHQGLSIQLVCN